MLPIRNELRNATNAILTAIAFAELLSACDYIILTLNTTAYGIGSRGPVNSLREGHIVIFCNILFLCCHFISVWLNNLLAVFRLIFVW